MGVIKRQGIKNTIVNYVGVLIGAVSVIFVYPLIDKTDLGVLKYSIDMATLFAPLASFASSLSIIHFFPVFRDEQRQNNGFLFFFSLTTLLTSLVFTFFLYIFKSPIATLFGADGVLFKNILPFILVNTVIVAFLNLYSSYSAIFNRIVFPSIFQNLILKVAQPLFVILLYGGYISLAQGLRGVSITLGVSFLALVVYIAWLGKLHWRPDFALLTPQLTRQIAGYSSFNILVSFGGMLAQRVDQMLIAPLLGFGATAIFGFGFFISEAIDIPRKAISTISAPLISESMKNNNIEHVNEIYRKSALLQTIVGTFLLAGVWSCADALFDLMPKNGEVFRTGKNVILILGLARLADMATGTNAEIITYSKFYRFNFVSLNALAVLNIALNLFFIQQMGIVGSALATLISVTIVNIWRLLYIRKNIGIQPLDVKMLWVILFGFLAWLAAYYTPSVSAEQFGKWAAILNIAAKASVVTTIFGFFIVKFRISTEINDGFTKMLNFVRRK